MKHILLVLAVLCFNISFAKDPAVTFSKKIDLPESGWNKTLLLKNGNTALLHIDQGALITLFIFDAAGNEIAQNGELLQYVDINKLTRNTVKGFYEINGQPTLFLDHIMDGYEGLIRIRFDNQTGKVTEEKIIDKAQRRNAPVNYMVSASPSGKYYAVMTYGGYIGPDEYHGYAYAYPFPFTPADRATYRQYDYRYSYCGYTTYYTNGGPYNNNYYNQYTGDNGKAYVDIRNEHDIPIKTTALPNSDLLGMYLDDSANLYTVCQDKDTAQFYAIYGSSVRDSAGFVNSIVACSVYHPIMARFYENNGAMCSLLLTEGDVHVDGKATTLVFGITLDINKADGSLSNIKKLAHSFCSQTSHTTMPGGEQFDRYLGIPYAITQLDGVKLVVSENTWKGSDFVGVPMATTEFKDICVTGMDDKGTELFGSTIPVSQRVRNQLRIYQLFKRQTESVLFSNTAHQSFLSQFAGCDTRKVGNYCVLLQNEPKDKKESNTLVDYTNENAAFYLVNKQGEMKKEFFLGNPADGSFRSAFIESTSFDASQNRFATLITETKGRKTEIKLVWINFEAN